MKHRERRGGRRREELVEDADLDARRAPPVRCSRTSESDPIRRPWMHGRSRERRCDHELRTPVLALWQIRGSAASRELAAQQVAGESGAAMNVARPASEMWLSGSLVVAIRLMPIVRESSAGADGTRVNAVVRR